MGLPARKTDRHYTYGDSRTWPDDERWELIDGVAWNMSAAPSTAATRRLLGRTCIPHIGGFPAGKALRGVLWPPSTCWLPESAEQEMDEVDSVVQPDLVVVCDPAKIVAPRLRGAPDLAVEILSPWTSKKDLAEKHALYERHGVREYLALDPSGRWLHVYRLGAEGRYGEPEVLLLEEGRPAPRVHLEVLPGFELDLTRVFA